MHCLELVPGKNCFTLLKIFGLGLFKMAAKTVTRTEKHVYKQCLQMG